MSNLNVGQDEVNKRERKKTTNCIGAKFNPL